MKIDPIQYFCPKCKKEYTNYVLMSFNSFQIESAKSFEEENEIITSCKDCGIRIVTEDCLKFFDNDGNLSIKKIVLEVSNKNLWNFFLDNFKDLFSLESFLNIGEIKICGIVEKIEENTSELNNFFLSKANLILVFDGKAVELYDIIFDKEKLVSGNRYNSFYGNYLTEKNIADTKFLASFIKTETNIKTSISHSNTLPTSQKKYHN